MRLCDGDTENWDYYLDAAVYIYRVTPIYKLKASPFKLLYGHDPKTIFLSDSTNPVGEEEIFKQLHNIQVGFQEEARRQRNAEIEKLNEGKGKSPSDLNIGDIVMKRLEPFERLNKLDDKWSGPFRVKEKRSHGNYLLESLSGKIFSYNRKDIHSINEGDYSDWEHLKEEDVLSDTATCLTVLLGN